MQRQAYLLEITCKAKACGHAAPDHTANADQQDAIKVVPQDPYDRNEDCLQQDTTCSDHHFMAHNR